MKHKGKLNIPSRQQMAAKPPMTQAAQAPVPQTPSGKPPGVMIAVPAMEMVNAEFAQHLAMSAANMVAHGIKINCAFNIGSVITIARRNLVDIFSRVILIIFGGLIRI